MIGRDHNVHFALTGNARRQNGRLIASATLYETVDDRTVWSRRFDVPDIAPNAWKSIIQGIYGKFRQTTMDVEVARAMREHPDRLDKRDFLFAALATSLLPITREHTTRRKSRCSSGRWPSIPTILQRYARMLFGTQALCTTDIRLTAKPTWPTR